jgi:hypothetical protein
VFAGGASGQFPEGFGEVEFVVESEQVGQFFVGESVPCQQGACPTDPSPQSGRHVDFSQGGCYDPILNQAFSADRPDFLPFRPNTDFLSNHWVTVK